MSSARDGSIHKNRKLSAGDAPPSSDNPKPSTARTMKKREADRKCQRNIREKRRAKIASLEQQVEELKEKDESGQIAILLDRLSERDAEMQAVMRKVKAIQDILSDQPSSHQTITTNSKSSGTRADQQPSKFFESRNTSQPSGLLPSSTESSHGFQLNQESNEYFEIDHDRTLHKPADLIYPPPHIPCGCSGDFGSSDGSGNYWRFANEVMSERFRWQPHTATQSDLFRNDIPVRAIVEGWHAVEVRGPLPPAWRILKKTDQSLFGKCNPRERLAALFVMHLLLESHFDPQYEPGLPDFYRKRPTEQVLHSYAINYYPWPGLREKFVQQQHRYCMNDFWRIFTKNLRILWPYELRDCYAHNLETGLYELSPMFQDRLRDLNSWTVGAELFERWPELRQDIPSFNSIPGSIHDPSTSAGPLAKPALSKVHRVMAFHESDATSERQRNEQALDLDGMTQEEAMHHPPWHLPTRVTDRHDWTPEALTGSFPGFDQMDLFSVLAESHVPPRE